MDDFLTYLIISQSGSTSSDCSLLGEGYTRSTSNNWSETILSSERTSEFGFLNDLFSKQMTNESLSLSQGIQVCDTISVSKRAIGSLGDDIIGELVTSSHWKRFHIFNCITIWL